MGCCLVQGEGLAAASPEGVAGGISLVMERSAATIRLIRLTNSAATRPPPLSAAMPWESWPNCSASLSLAA
jgi:hypothetical protein